MIAFGQLNANNHLAQKRKTRRLKSTSFDTLLLQAGKINDEEKSMLRDDEDNVWKVTAVLNILLQLTEKCNINQQLIAMEKGEAITEDIAGEFGMKPIYTMTGWLSFMIFASNVVGFVVVVGDHAYELQLK